MKRDDFSVRLILLSILALPRCWKLLAQLGCLFKLFLFTLTFTVTEEESLLNSVPKNKSRLSVTILRLMERSRESTRSPQWCGDSTTLSFELSLKFGVKQDLNAFRWRHCVKLEIWSLGMFRRVWTWDPWKRSMFSWIIWRDIQDLLQVNGRWEMQTMWTFGVKSWGLHSRWSERVLEKQRCFYWHLCCGWCGDWFCQGIEGTPIEIGYGCAWMEIKKVS